LRAVYEYMTRVDFSRNATVYDRRHGALLGPDEVERLCAVASLERSARVLDIGAGTGRVAVPLAERGCAVVAVEPARGMVDELRAKAGSDRLAVVIGEGGLLPFQSRTFDTGVIARVLYLASDWRHILREARRVITTDGLLLHEWGNGQPDEPWVQIREEARRLFETAGVPQAFHPGVRSEAEVSEELERLGFIRVSDVLLGPGPQLTLREFLRRLVDGELSYIWDVPKKVQADCLPRLAAWCEQHFDLDRPVAIPKQISWTIYRAAHTQP
jgi:ubiquinone/menaquinone biosynthesis C-methylase UbiE